MDKDTSGSLSQALIELSDAIEQLAVLLAKQKTTENQIGIKELAVVTRRFKQLGKELSKTQQTTRKTIQEKQRKGHLIKFLAEKGIYAGNYIDSLLTDKHLYNAADYLADHYRQLENFYKQLKRSQILKKDLTLKANSIHIEYIKKWSEILHKNKLIDGYVSYNNNRMEIDIAEIHRATKFINGYWLEVFLRSEISQFFRKNLDKIQSFDILAQVEVQMPDKKTSELDLLIMLNEQVYWFECKSGRVGKEYYSLFKKHRKYMQLPRTRSFLLVPDMNLNQAEALDKKAGMTLLYATQLPFQLKKILKF